MNRWGAVRQGGNRRVQDDREIPFHRPPIGEDEIRAVTEVLRSGWITTGPRAAQLESAFATYVGARHAVAVNSGTAGLHLSLLAAGVAPGDCVLTTPFTFPATVEAIAYCGARPVFADVCPDTLNLDSGRARDIVEAGNLPGRLRVLLPVHYAGQPAALENLLPLARKHGLRVVEDAAHALPAWRRLPGVRRATGSASRDHLSGEAWVTIGSAGDFTAFSFYATKPLTTGEGGMITFDDDAADTVLRSLRLHGMSGDAWKRYESDQPWYYEVGRAGFKYNLPDVLAAIGLVQLDRADALARERRRLALLYTESLRSLADHLEPLGAGTNAGHAWHLFVIRLREPRVRNRIVEKLRSRRIGVSVHFVPIHYHPHFAATWGLRRGEFPVAESAYEQILSLPIYPGLGEEGVGRVVGALAEELQVPASRASVVP